MCNEKVSMMLVPTVALMAMIKKAAGILIPLIELSVQVMGDISLVVTNGKKRLMFPKMMRIDNLHASKQPSCIQSKMAVFLCNEYYQLCW